MDPLDDRILAVTARVMAAIRRQGDVGAEREVLEGVRRQAMTDLKNRRLTNEERAKLVTIAVQANLNLANVRPLRGGELIVDY